MRLTFNTNGYDNLSCLKRVAFCVRAHNLFVSYVDYSRCSVRTVHYCEYTRIVRTMARFLIRISVLKTTRSNPPPVFRTRNAIAISDDLRFDDKRTPVVETLRTWQITWPPADAFTFIIIYLLQCFGGSYVGPRERNSTRSHGGVNNFKSTAFARQAHQNSTREKTAVNPFRNNNRIKIICIGDARATRLDTTTAMERANRSRIDDGTGGAATTDSGLVAVSTFSIIYISRYCLFFSKTIMVRT